MSSRPHHFLIQLAYLLSILPLLAPASLFPLGAILIIIYGTIIHIHRYQCMRGQPGGRFYTICCLFGLWSSIAISLTPAHNGVTASIAVLCLTSLLCLCGPASLTWKQRITRVAAYWFPMGFAALIPFSLRHTQTGECLSQLAIAILIIHGIIILIWQIRHRNQYRSSRATNLLIIFWMLSTTMSACSIQVNPPVLRLFFILGLSPTIAVFVWGRRLSNFLQRSCGEQHLEWLRYHATLTILAPIGFTSYACYLLTSSS